MPERVGETGLQFHEPLLWEQGKSGRSGFSLPVDDTGAFTIDPDITGDVPDMPELSEGDIVRHYTRLSQWNYGIESGMYPLGSCTMKYNPKINESLAALPGFSDVHPMLPEHYLQGTLKLMYDLERFLGEITGMDAVSLQPSAGAQGELTGVMIIHASQKNRGERRKKFIIPNTAHGTNPASIALCGYIPIKLDSNEKGIITRDAVAEIMDDDVAGIMVTNPNTLGFFEEHIIDIARVVHDRGGLVYCDGANMNALMGIARMGDLGVDVMHVNLHKTFSSPHGGGGPGAGPVCVKDHLAPFLPVPRIVVENYTYCLTYDKPLSVGRVHSFFGNVGVLVRAYCYILTMGAENLKKAAELAVLNANYIRQKLKGTYDLPYDRMCLHECVFSFDTLKNHVTALDVAKRLIDYGFHPPTIYFPLVVSSALMIEPTETESKETIDAFVDALKAIADEAESHPDLLRDAPHNSKVRRIDETHAARNLCLRD